MNNFLCLKQAGWESRELVGFALLCFVVGNDNIEADNSFCSAVLYFDRELSAVLQTKPEAGWIS